MVLAARLFVILALGLALMSAFLAQPFIAESQQTGQSQPSSTLAGSDDATTSSTPTSGTQELMLLGKFQPWMLMVLVLSALAALLIWLFMIYQYINNIRTTEFHRQILLDAVTQFRFTRLMEDGSHLVENWIPSFPSADETPEQRATRARQEEVQQQQREQQRKEFESKSRQKASDEAAILVPRSLSVTPLTM